MGAGTGGEREIFLAAKNAKNAEKRVGSGESGVGSGKKFISSLVH